MKHKTKLFLTVLMAVLLVMCLMPATAFAADYSININDDSMNTSVSSGNKEVSIGGGKISYDATSNTLTLDNVNLTCNSENNAAIYVPNVSDKDLNLVLKGTNTINAKQCVSSNGNLRISGDGKLNATGTIEGIYTAGDLTIDGAKVTASTTKTNAGVHAKGSVTIQNEATVEASSTDAWGIYGYEGISIDNSNVTASSANKAGMQADSGDITITNSEVTASSANQVGMQAASGDITITNSEVNATTEAPGSYDEKYGYLGWPAIWSNNVTISGGNVTATATGQGANAINANSTIAITNKAVVTARATNEHSYPALFGNNGISVSDSTVDATSGGNSSIYSPATVTIENGSDVTTSGYYCGIQGNTDVTISESKVDATSTNDVAIYSKVNVNITDSVVKAQAVAGANGILGGTIDTPAASASGSWIATSGTESFEGNITNSVLINGISGNVIGAAVVPDDVTIPAGTTLTVPEGTSLTVPEGVTLTNEGTVVGADKKEHNNGYIYCNNHNGGTATCAKKAVCALCGQEYGDLAAHIPENVENVEHVDAKAATCAAEGNIEYWHCTTCDKYYSDENLTTAITEEATKIAKIEHTWDEGKITTDPTYDATGVKTYTCTACGETKTEDIPKKERPSGPSVPTTPADNVTNSGSAGTDSATTTADINTTLSGSTASATVDKTTADKIVDKATKNQSAEVVVDATTTTGKSDNTTVTIPKDTVQKIADKTDADVTIKTDAAEVALDQKAVKAVAAKAAASDVKIVVEKTKDETKAMEFELKVVSGGVVIGEFDGGNVKVTVKLNAALAALKDDELTCVHIDDNGKYSKVKGAKNNDGTYTFITTHFSSYAIMTKEEADAAIGAQVEELVKGLDDIDLVARSVRTPKGNVKVTLKVDKEGKALIDEIKEAGYTVKYHFYRSTKKSAGYVSKLMKETKTYTNTYGKKGTRYYYKARVQVYDAEGKLIAKTALKDCKYATRLWKK